MVVLATQKAQTGELLEFRKFEVGRDMTPQDLPPEISACM